MMDADPKGETFAYTRGLYVIVRNIKDPSIAYTYNGHAVPASAVRYAPSGNYIASGDAKGQIKIWDTTMPDHKTKFEYHVLGGAVADIAWSEDSKRLGVAGNGNDTYARAILWDSGSNCGDLNGHIKKCNGIDIKPCRPYRLVTAGEDTEVGFFAGPPFKRDKMIKDNAKFVNGVRYSPDGTYFVTADAGGKIFLYDGKDGSLKHEIGPNAHSGGCYGVSWSADSKHFVSCSADKTIKIWDAEANKNTVTFIAGTDVMDQQVGCVWVGDTIISTSLSGNMNFWDKSSPNAPTHIIKGHKENATAMALDTSSGKLFTGCTEGRVTTASISDGKAEYLAGHKSLVVAMAVENGKLISAAMDDTVRVTPVGADALGTAVKLSSQPKGVGALGDLVGVAGLSHITLVRGGTNRVCELATPYAATCIAFSKNGTEVAVGGEDKKVHIYTLDNDTLTEKDTLDCGDVVLCIGYSPDGAYLAASGVKRQVLVWDASKYGEPVQQRWKHHTSKVTCLAWSPDSNYIATGSLDTNIIIWNMSKPMSRIMIKEAHPSAMITAVQWGGDNELFSSGYDGCVRSWNIKL